MKATAIAKTANDVILYTLLVVGIALILGRPLVGQIALTFSAGGIMTAAGYWEPEGNYIQPIWFLLTALLGAGGTKFLLSKDWQAAAGKENDIWIIPFFLTSIAFVSTFLCMWARYLAY